MGATAVQQLPLCGYSPTIYAVSESAKKGRDTRGGEKQKEAKPKKVDGKGEDVGKASSAATAQIVVTVMIASGVAHKLPSFSSFLYL